MQNLEGQVNLHPNNVQSLDVNALFSMVDKTGTHHDSRKGKESAQDDDWQIHKKKNKKSKQVNDQKSREPTQEKSQWIPTSNFFSATKEQENDNLEKKS